jgi:hypothetical protein
MSDKYAKTKRSRKCKYLLYRRLEMISRSNKNSLSESRNTALHNSSNQEFYKIYLMERYERIYERFEDSLLSDNGKESTREFRENGTKMVKKLWICI